MKISTLTVCRNAEKTIEHTLRSFLEQSHDDKEMIVVDGNSSDRTCEIVEAQADERIKLISEPDHGMYDALNKALRCYTGDAMGVLNADDRYHDSQVLARIASALKFDDIVHGHLNFVDDHGTNGRITRRWRARPMPTNGFRAGWMPAHPTFYTTRLVAEKVGEFNTSLAIAADYDWMVRALELFDFRSAVIDHVLVDMKTGGQSTKSVYAHIAHNLEALKSRRRWLDAGLVDYALLAKPARKIGQFMARGG